MLNRISNVHLCVICFGFISVEIIVITDRFLTTSALRSEGTDRLLKIWLAACSKMQMP